MFDFLASILLLITDLFVQNPLGQGVGLFAMLVGVTAFSQKDDKRLRQLLTVFTLLIACHFALMGWWAAALSALIGTARNYASIHVRNTKVMLFFMALLLLIAAPRVEHWTGILALMGAAWATWGVFKESGVRLRVFMLLGTISWLSHNILVGSIGGSIIETIFLLVNGLTIWRLIQDRQNEEDKASV